MEYSEILQTLAQWVWSIYNGGAKFFGFLFSPISESITTENGFPQWIVTATETLTNIIGINVTPIALVGVSGIIIAIVVGLIKAVVS